jgi:hypothetical protein
MRSDKVQLMNGGRRSVGEWMAREVTQLAERAEEENAAAVDFSSCAGLSNSH